MNTEKYNQKIEELEMNSAHEVAQQIIRAIESGVADVEMIQEFVAQNPSYREMLDGFASPQRFSEESGRINIAFNARRTDVFLHKLASRQLMRVRKRRLMVFSSSAVAAIFLLSLYIYQINKIDLPDVAQVQQSTKLFSVPTLTIEREVIELDAKKTEIKAGEYVAQRDILQHNGVLQTLTVPCGYTYKVILADGSQVELNAGSELSYPTNFDGDSRTVRLKGEAFFSVEKSDKPFVVQVDKGFVNVYGTQFNVNSRQDKQLSVILVEGSVGVGSKGNTVVKIAPNEMIDYNYFNGEYCVEQVDTEQYLGWRNGLFFYADKSTGLLFDEIERWYNIKLNCPDMMIRDVKINISMSRTTTIDDMLLFVGNMINVKFIKERSGVYSVVGGESN